jgi:CRP-like cAMP-binding protein
MAPIEHVYFIEEGLVSVLARTGEREDAEAWLIGREGLVGLPVIFGGAALLYRRVVQVGGRALRIGAGEFCHAVEERPVLRHHVLRYTHAVLVQAGQNGACAARHSVEQRVARWLLQAQDSLGRSELPMTHALLSRLIGVRRASITVTIGRLEAAGILQQEWGGITILDLGRLTQVACDCYRVIKTAYEAV